MDFNPHASTALILRYLFGPWYEKKTIYSATKSDHISAPQLLHAQLRLPSLYIIRPTQSRKTIIRCSSQAIPQHVTLKPLYATLVAHRVTKDSQLLHCSMLLVL